MILLTNRSHTTTAVIHNNILALPDGKVVGILLGHCVFGAEGKVLAKYFKHHLYTLEGKVLAIEDGTADKVNVDTSQLLQDAWLLIMRIKDHTCPIITPTEIWTGKTINEHFMAYGAVSA
jgi:hypothetical protein